MSDRQKDKDIPHLISSMDCYEALKELNKFSDDPIYQPLITLLEQRCKFQKEAISQARDSLKSFMNGNCVINFMDLFNHLDSPTAQKYISAIINFSADKYLLSNYKKETVNNLDDCDYLGPAFQHYVFGHINENSGIGGYWPPENASNLVTEYLKLKPSDIFAEYFKVLLIMRKIPSDADKSQISDYKRNKIIIRTGEIFANKIQTEYDSSSCKSLILIDIYYLLGAFYSVTKQRERSLDAFQKCLHLDTSNYGALYAVAHKTMETGDTENAKKLLYQFLDMAPVCDKKYPSAHYLLASLFKRDGNMAEALRYCTLGEDVEKHRLPFLNEEETAIMKIMKTFKRTFSILNP